MIHIPFETRSQRHTVYAYAAVFLLHAGYAINLWWQTRKANKPTA